VAKITRRTAKNGFPIDHAMQTLRREVKKWRTPAVTILASERGTPYKVLIATILSLRTQDKTTGEASARLFALADTPGAMLRLSEETIARAIKPVGFYNNKAKTILELSKRLMEEHGGSVPDSVEKLTEFKGVGRKTANLVVTLGYNLPGICVDTHVHRITNRWGYVRTKTPDETEMALRRVLPKKYWIPINDWLVAFGQNLCKPISPICSECKIRTECARKGVKVFR
jgi:endonuclease-3